MQSEDAPLLLPTRTSVTPRHFLEIASLLYVGVLVTGVYYSAAGLCIPSGFFGVGVQSTSAFVLLIGFLLVAELTIYQCDLVIMPRAVAVGLLLGRMALFELVIAADCSGLARALYPLVPFVAYFSLGKWASYGLSIFYIGFFVLKLSAAVPNWFLDQAYVSDLLMFFIGLVFAVSMARVASEAEAQRQRAEYFLNDLTRSHQKLRLYAEQVAELATIEERNRLARDIHDSLGHYLTTINVLLEKAIAFRKRNAQEADQAVVDAKRLSREALQDVRQSVSALRLAGEVFSLRGSLQELVKSAARDRFDVSLEWKSEAEEVQYSKPVLIGLFRVAQEAITNTRKHANATRVHIAVDLTEQEASISVQDDGHGFEPRLLDELGTYRQDRFGLQGLRERLALIGGTLRIESSSQHGTFVQAVIPKQPLKSDTLETMMIPDATQAS
jgi:signal transduction histidine kinase